MALSKLIRPAEIHSDHRGVVQASSKGEVECINATSKDTDLWIQMWNRVKVRKEQDLRLRVGLGQG